MTGDFHADVTADVEAVATEEAATIRVVLLRIEGTQVLDFRYVEAEDTEEGWQYSGKRILKEHGPLNDGTWFMVNLDDHYGSPRFAVETMQEITRLWEDPTD